MAYKTIKEIGRGSFGVVELVLDDRGAQMGAKDVRPTQSSRCQ